MFRLAPALAALVVGAALAVPAAAQEAPAAPAPAQDVSRTPIGDWTKLCVNGGAACVIEQIGRTAAGEDALSFQVEKLAEPQVLNGTSVEAVANIRVPLGVVLTQGLRLRVDQGEVAASPYFICQETGCLVRAPLQPQLLESLRRGAKATVAYTVIRAGQPQEISSDLSLSGFTRALEDL